MAPIDESIQALCQLIGFDSVSSTSNAAISSDVAGRLESLGFTVEQTQYVDARGQTKVNLVARRDPAGSTSSRGSEPEGGLAYFCHTDVVPASGWTGPGGNPFDAVVQDGRIFGRGSCDMKGSLVAMLAAAARVPVARQRKPLWIVCTADEEVGFDGARHIVQHSNSFRELVQAQPMGIIGEPTGMSVVHAHKGITGVQFTSRGRAAHSSTADGINANESMVPILQLLLELGQQTKTDPRYHDDRFDPPTLSWNFGVSDGCTAVNITPETSKAWLSLRSMPDVDGEDLISQLVDKANSSGLEVKRFEGGRPVWIEADSACIQDLCQIAGGQPSTVCFGTDGGEFAELKQMAVWGPGHIAQAHTTDEWLSIDQLSKGIELYAKAITHWCVDKV
ncbi:M20 family metallopeptidase [Planctomycetes bacterium K23_9]|uniref:Acetylornithine deacetylase n=1 Tax=Stieleria marina TaxID=1930275 RepID=A0A517P2B7_9BACT|nr:Acetylornithine deacetylase [Planctomycetes bacterium K23_9]